MRSAQYYSLNLNHLPQGMVMVAGKSIDTKISSGVTLNPSMTLGELFDQVQRAGRSGNEIDQRLLANLLQLLNGDDPQGRCR